MTQPSIRGLIADGMEALAFAPHPGSAEASYDETVRLLDGAATLRWCDDNDPDNADPCHGEVDELEEVMGAVAALVMNDKTKLAERVREVLGI